MNAADAARDARTRRTGDPASAGRAPFPRPRLRPRMHNENRRDPQKIIHVVFGPGGGRISELPRAEAKAPPRAQAPMPDPREPITDVFSASEACRLLGVTAGRLRSLDRAVPAEAAIENALLMSDRQGQLEPADLNVQELLERCAEAIRALEPERAERMHLEPAPHIQVAESGGLLARAVRRILRQALLALPQGAPTSPAITNAICLRMDRRMSGLARKLGFIYTRYADDLAFSWRRNGTSTKAPIASLLKRSEEILKSEGFTPHPTKTKILRKGNCQRVTGLVVNHAPGKPKARVPRDVLRRLRAAIHNREKGKPGKEGSQALQELAEQTQDNDALLVLVLLPLLVVGEEFL